MRRSNAPVLLAFGLAALPACRGSAPRPAPLTTASAATDRAPVASPPAPSTHPVEPRPLHVPRAAAPAPEEGAPESPLWVRCAEGFAPATTPEADVMRLGTACGPVNGLTLLRRWTGSVDEANPPAAATHRWDAERGDCFRVFAVAEPTVEDLEVEVERPNGTDGSGGLLANQSRRWVLVSEDRPFCAPRAGELVARVSTHGGKGRYALAVWRGARMMKPPRKG